MPSRRGCSASPGSRRRLPRVSRAVEGYLASAGLIEPLRALGFGIVGYACTSCNGMSGPLPEAIEAEILKRNLPTAAVLSGNRNFNGRIHPRVKEAFIASPALVVAYALTGSIRIDIENEALGVDGKGQPVMLSDLWPSDEEVEALLKAHVRGEHFSAAYKNLFGSSETRIGACDRFATLRLARGQHITSVARRTGNRN